jgi:hypothetical protein
VVTRSADGAGNLLTSNSTTPTSKFALDSNITSILGTAPTTVGKLDVKGADGDVFVRQTTGTNLHVVLDTTSTTAVTQATAANLNATIIGTGTFADQSTLKPATSGGLTIFNASVTTVQSVKSSAGQLYGYHILNTTAAIAYVQVWNLGTGSITLGTTAPTFVLGLPANGGATFNSDIGIAFATAISVAATTTRAGSATAACEITMFYN